MVLLGALVAAWAVPALTHLVGVDWLLIPVYLAAVVGLQRGLTTLLDRLVVAIVQSFGALVVAGLFFSYVGKLHPVVLAGSALTLLVAAATRRDWRAPRLYRPADLAVLAGAVGVAALTVVPFALRDLGGRIGIVAGGEDIARHMTLFEQIGRFGGFAFLHPPGDATLLPAAETEGIRAYPQGIYYTYAVVDRFLRSSDTSSTDPFTAVDTMLWLYVVTFVVLALVVLWSAARIAGPGARPLAVTAALAVVAAGVFFGEPVAVFVRGYPNELAGLVVAAALTALVVRPLTSRIDQIVTVALLVIALSFTYHLFLPFAGLLVLGWVARYRVWRSWQAVVIGVLAVPIVAITPIGLLHATTTQLLTSAGTALPSDKPAALLLVLLAAAGLVAVGGLRSPARRMAAFALLAAVSLQVVMGAWQLLTIGRTHYYFDKLLHVLVIVMLVLMGSLARLATTNGRRPLAVTAVVVGAVAGFFVVAGGRNHAVVPSYGVRLATGIDRGSPGGGRDAVFIASRFPEAENTVDVDLMGDPYRNFFGTLYGSVLQRNYRYGHDWYNFLNPTRGPRTLADLERQVSVSPVRVRIHVSDPRARFLTGPDAPTNVDAATLVAQRYPDRVQVVTH
ncbi:hypothetical protein GCM10009557_06840 [Virgisporangium ochraceum]